jgi:hypothetical protein
MVIILDLFATTADGRGFDMVAPSSVISFASKDSDQVIRCRLASREGGAYRRVSCTLMLMQLMIEASEFWRNEPKYARAFKRPLKVWGGSATGGTGGQRWACSLKRSTLKDVDARRGRLTRPVDCVSMPL